MSISRFGLRLAAALLLAGPGVALSQENVPFQDIQVSAYGAHGPPRQVVARNQQELRSAGFDVQGIDWQREMVVGVLMGTQASSGYSIRIESIQRERLPVMIMIFPPPPPTYEVVVRYRETRPAFGDIVATVLTAPYHLVKLPRYRSKVRFERLSDASGVDVREVSGRLASSDQGLRLLDDHSGQALLIRPQEQADALAAFVGRTVRVRGSVLPGGKALRVSEVLSPQRRGLSGMVKNGELYVATSLTWQRIDTSGPAAEVLRRAEQRLVTCDAHVFTDASGAIREARIESVQGRMKRRSLVVDGAHALGHAAEGEQVRVLGLAAWNRLARIEAQVGTGWVPASRVEVGFLPTPTPTPASAGMIEALGD